MQDYADGILNKLDPDKKYIKHRLYRQHTSITGMSFVKDLSKLGRDLNRVIIIDNLIDNFKLQPNNGLGIKTWLDEMNDCQLNDIGLFLKNLIEKKPYDVRTIISKVKDEVSKREKKNNLNPYRNLSIDKYI
jgi:TFIIF-interacting CTD phosphatase-like protein